MTNLDHDPLAAAFDDFRGRVAPFVKPAGADRTREAMRTRTRRRGLAAAALTVLVIAIPLTVQAVWRTDPHGLPAAPVLPDPRVSASTHYFVGPGQNSRPSRTAPEGGIAEATLYSSVIDLPAWPEQSSRAGCPAGPVEFQDGDTQNGRVTLWIAGVVHADADRDGRAETFARIFCMSDNDIASRILALTNGSGGGVRTVGTVIEQAADAVAICGIRAGTDGAIQVEIADFPMAWRCAERQLANERYISRQWLTFTWNGSSFVQQGEADRTVNPYASDLKLTGTDLVMTRQANGRWTGSMTLTVRNLGASKIPYRTQSIIMAGMKLIDPPPGCTMGKPQAGMVDVFCTGAELAAGGTRTLTLNIDTPKRARLTFVPSTELLPLNNGYNDPDESNNNAPLAIEFRD
ncbi:hypothetical protein [Actinoplanes italicus]|uniref:CARDB protein n=1 Tax=Actinoplanes italicus TaxID=113567 RepID=A0A2T0KFX0_9ACTN|nr:hypothetical protein [Actinoplanes italicus]PRX22253.1 hypothetical protein CLV67_105430 [Actinoplanes italicus]